MVDIFINQIKQKIIDDYMISPVLAGNLFTQKKRHELHGNVSGGANSTKPEKFQRNHVIQGTGSPCEKTHMRINWRTNKMVEIGQPMRKDDGFDYTEDFDGKQVFTSNTVWINFKSIVGSG